jgi:hypothetical protein
MAKRLTDEDKYYRSQSEWQFQNFVIARAINNGWSYYHAPDNKPDKNGRVQSGIVKGFPDLVLVKGAVLVFVELKTETGRISPEQTVWLARLAATGCETHIWRPSQWKEVNDYLESK